MNMKYGALATLLFIPAAGSSFAAGTASFDDLDKNQDGQLSTEEASKDADLGKVWNSVDTDKDGTITRAEFSAFESKPEQSGGSDESGSSKTPGDSGYGGGM